MKLSKAQLAAHRSAEELLAGSGRLSQSEIQYVFEHWRPDSHTVQGQSAFFTPPDMAAALTIEVTDAGDGHNRYLDLCAGIGVLAYCALPEPRDNVEITCVEQDERFCEVGKRLLPAANWLQMDVVEFALQEKPQSYSCFISNPPYSSTVKARETPAYKQAQKQKILRRPTAWPYAVAEIGCYLASYGVMLLSRQYLDWKFSGKRSFQRVSNASYRLWHEKTGIELAPNCGIDLSLTTGFRETKIPVEIAVCSFASPDERSVRE